MKTAEEVAEEITELVYDCVDNDGEWNRRSLAVKEVAKLLTTFAEERVKEATEERGKLFQNNVANFPNELKQARAEALEEAAGVADSHAKVKGLHIHKGFQYCVNQVAEDIRTLNDKAGK